MDWCSGRRVLPADLAPPPCGRCDRWSTPVANLSAPSHCSAGGEACWNAAPRCEHLRVRCGKISACLPHCGQAAPPDRQRHASHVDRCEGGRPRAPTVKPFDECWTKAAMVEGYDGRPGACTAEVVDRR